MWYCVVWQISTNLLEELASPYTELKEVGAQGSSATLATLC